MRPLKPVLHQTGKLFPLIGSLFIKFYNRLLFVVNLFKQINEELINERLFWELATLQLIIQ